MIFVDLFQHVIPQNHRNSQLFYARWIVHKRVTTAVGATVQIFIAVVQFFDNAKEVIDTMYYHVSKVCAVRSGESQ
jgi:hypothetical protein